MALLKGWRGIRNTESGRGQNEKRRDAPVKSVESNSGHSGKLHGSVLKAVGRLFNFRANIQNLGRAFIAALHSLRTSIGIQSVVPVTVQTRKERRTVYNLTLAEHNAYYANGMLVFNCADAFCLTFAVHATVKGPQSLDPQYFEDF
jgi:intein/homing endonuclease